MRRYHISGSKQGTKPIAKSENQTAEERSLRSKLSENNRCNGNKALSHNNGRPELGYRCKRNEGTAKSGQKTGKNNRNVADAIDIDSQGFTGTRMLSAGTKSHAIACFKENKPKHQHQHKTKICHRIGADHIIEERACGELSHKHFRKFRRCIQSRTVRRIFKNSLTEKNRKARAYKIDSCSGNGLIRMKADANYRMD